MATNVFDRLVGINLDENANKIPVHSFYTALMAMSRGAVSQAAVIQKFDLDADDFTEGDIATLFGATTSKLKTKDHLFDKLAGLNVWSLLLLAEEDRDDVFGLRDKSKFLAAVALVIKDYDDDKGLQRVS